MKTSTSHFNGPDHQANRTSFQKEYLTSLLQYARHVIFPRLIASLILFLASIILSQAQERDQKTQARILLRQAMLDIDRLDYDKAITKLLDHRSISQENANVCYLLGISYLYSGKRPRSMEKASFYLNKAAKNINTEYEFWILDEMAAPPETFYHLGKAEEQLEKFEEAANAFENYLVILEEDKQITRSKMYALIKQTALEFQMAADNKSSEESVVDLNLTRNDFD